MEGGGKVSVIADVRFNIVMAHSPKCCIGFIVYIRNKHGNTPRDYTNVFILGFYLF
jgi:hypothetical protein